MAGKPVICLGDTTDHGGVVISALNNYSINGRPVATEGDSVSCPKCKGVFQIASGSSLMTFQSKKIALEGMKTTCGATLIASQSVKTSE
ncbi:TPA: PAAR domain-containing protein [Morganella morganii]|uniref:PAAR domain-containing protein n=1 Tax=Morganella morganii TaxID=582 RepID=UPI000B408470|nr:PAAR domain-containing protein [Morganella morganii]EKW7746685.1 PAAR domain-containing protein [Morganella morganii]ELB1545249.1 PAAR domain-containing protein [Morganella morganii]MBT0313831.1 PAAR domain-containing protein [Morganella morganii subsp. morganii]MBT0464158.1 PAAR domain-containing protein [Morganella morganii subsp. morganii]MBT0468709.1 PAAR domain-containing protein [Morganella morganii subsp. morganii]